MGGRTMINTILWRIGLILWIMFLMCLAILGVVIAVEEKIKWGYPMAVLSIVLLIMTGLIL